MSWLYRPKPIEIGMNSRCDDAFTDPCPGYNECGNRSCIVYGCDCNYLYCWHKNIFD